jgi:hypothetical protein
MPKRKGARKTAWLQWREAINAVKRQLRRCTFTTSDRVKKRELERATTDEKMKWSVCRENGIRPANHLLRFVFNQHQISNTSHISRQIMDIVFRFDKFMSTMKTYRYRSPLRNLFLASKQLCEWVEDLIVERATYKENARIQARRMLLA